MKRKSMFFKKLLLIALMVIMAFSMAACGGNNPVNPGGDDGNGDGGDGTPERTSFKILSIGNSFSDDAHTYLFKIARALGEKNIIVANLYIGGSSLNTHYNNAKNDSAAYSFQLYNTTVRKDLPDYTIKMGLEYTAWDFITIQQVSQDSGKIDSLEKEKLDYMTDYMKTHSKNPDAKIGWHSTWAYAQTSTHSGFPYYSSNQMTMYNKIVEAGQYLLENNPSFDFLIPNMTVLQNARTSYLGDTLCRDGYHLSMPDGRFIAGVGFYKGLTGKDVTPLAENLDLADVVSTSIRRIAVEAAEAAYTKPYEVTASKITEKPTKQ